jgi:hypothetical protein
MCPHVVSVSAMDYGEKYSDHLHVNCTCALEISGERPVVIILFQRRLNKETLAQKCTFELICSSFNDLFFYKMNMRMCSN